MTAGQVTPHPARSNRHKDSAEVIQPVLDWISTGEQRASIAMRLGGLNPLPITKCLSLLQQGEQMTEEPKMTHAVVILCMAGNLGLSDDDGHQVLLFPSELAATQWAVDRIVAYKDGWTRNQDGHVVWDDGVYDTDDYALADFQDECLGSVQYFHVVDIGDIASVV